MGKKAGWLGILMLALPLAAFADSLGLSNAGVPNGVIFNGTFSGTHTYTLKGALAAMNGEVGATTQLAVNTGTDLFSGSAQLSSGDTNLNFMVPEPGTLTLFGTGLLGLAGFIRYKRKTSHL